MRKLVLIVFMCLSFLGLSCQSRQQFKSVDVEQFEKFISENDVTLLDVRTAEEYSDGHIPGTDFNIDVLEDSFTRIAVSKLPETKPVALYCRSGNRSKKASQILSSKGYEVVELSTGFRGWVASGKPVGK